MAGRGSQPWKGKTKEKLGSSSLLSWSENNVWGEKGGFFSFEAPPAGTLYAPSLFPHPLKGIFRAGAWNWVYLSFWRVFPEFHRIFRLKCGNFPFKMQRFWVGFPHFGPHFGPERDKQHNTLGFSKSQFWRFSWVSVVFWTHRFPMLPNVKFAKLDEKMTINQGTKRQRQKHPFSRGRGGWGCTNSGPPEFRGGPNTVSESTVQTPSSVSSFGPDRVPGTEFSELLSVYYLCAKTNPPNFFVQSSPSLPQNSES